MANRNTQQDGTTATWQCWFKGSWVYLDDMKLNKSTGFRFRKNLRRNGRRQSERQQRFWWMIEDMGLPILHFVPGKHLYIKYNFDAFDGDMLQYTDLSKPQPEPKAEPKRRSRKPKVEANPELVALREQLAAMQAVLDKLVA